MEALIAIGSNIQPEDNIERALALLDRQVPVLAVSTFYWSDPWGNPDQPRFLNGACRVAPACDPVTLKSSILRAIETELGRVRTPDKNAPCTIDLDIALFGEMEIAGPGLTVPDPELTLRPFLAVPLAELAPDWSVPGLRATLMQIAATLDATGLTVHTELTARLKEKYSK